MLKYRLNEKNEYVLKKGSVEIVMGEEIAISVSFNQDGYFMLLKHGVPELVQEWHHKNITLLKNVGMGHLVDSHLIKIGKFDVEDLNKSISISGYVKKLFLN